MMDLGLVLALGVSVIAFGFLCGWLADRADRTTSPLVGALVTGLAVAGGLSVLFLLADTVR